MAYTLTGARFQVVEELQQGLLDSINISSDAISVNSTNGRPLLSLTYPIHLKLWDALCIYRRTPVG